MSADLRTLAVRRSRFFPPRAAALAWAALPLLLQLPVLATVCPAPPPPAPSGVCAATAGDAGLLLRGTVLAPGEVLENGHLLLDAAGTIVCAACDCSASPGYATATRIDCLDGVISPGLVNGVDVLTFAQNQPADWGDERFEHRHDWRLGQNGHSQIDAVGGASAAQQRWGELRQRHGRHDRDARPGPARPAWSQPRHRESRGPIEPVLGRRQPSPSTTPAAPASTAVAPTERCPRPRPGNRSG